MAEKTSDAQSLVADKMTDDALMSPVADQVIRNISSVGALAVLPNHVAFKNDGKLLSAQVRQGYNYLEFSGNDSGNERVWNEVHPLGNGNVCIKSRFYGSFWRRSPNWIWGDSAYKPENLDTVFYPIQLSDTEVALRNLGNDYFCKRLTTEGKTNCLNAGTSTITNEARLQVVELVLSRKVYDVDFDLSSAKIYNVKPITMVSAVAINDTNQPNDNEIKVSYEEKTSSTWNSQVAFKTHVSTSLSSGVPLIGDVSVEIGFEYSDMYEWGETKETTTNIETVYKVTVPAKTKVTVNLLATEGTCDVPFTYTQEDLLINGQVETSKMLHGVYTGINAYNFKYETKEEPL